MTDNTNTEVSSDLGLQLGGIVRLYGQHAYQKLAGAHLCIIGLGGVGSWTAEALVRSGIGRLTLVDLDDVCITNTNRQLQALHSTVGRSKIAVMAERLIDINAEVKIDLVHDFLTEKTAETILNKDFDVVVDAIDHFKHKCSIALACRAQNIPQIIVGGAGGRIRADKVRLADISKSEGDKLLSMLKKRLRQKHHFPRKGSWKIPCIYSNEVPRYPDGKGGVSQFKAEESLRMDCETGYGSAAHVTGTFGLFAAQSALECVLKN